MKMLFFGTILCGFFMIGMLRLLSLDAHWSSDEARWLHRSADFLSAVKKGKFSDTLIAYHPGVTTAWIAGLRTFFTEPGLNVSNLARARWFIGIVVWIGIGIACLLLYKLFDRWVALASFACLAFSPLFLAQTRRVHTDTLATVFVLLTVLILLTYCQNRQSCHTLVLSGIAFGLAVLSKSYALILVPWVLFCLFLFHGKPAAGRFTPYTAEVLCFFNCATLTVLAIFPIFWTTAFGILGFCLLCTSIIFFHELKKKRTSLTNLTFVSAVIVLVIVCIHVLQTATLVFDRVSWAVTTPHEVEHFFLGKVVNDPGWLFYLFVLTIKSTPLMLPLAFLGCVLLWKQRNQSEESARYFRVALSLLVGVVLFTVCLSATSKKFSRYLLPAFPMLEILAAIGLVQGFKWIYAALCSRFQTLEVPLYKNALLVIACIAFFFIQTLPVLALHPYYGTYYNPCWKATDITKIITVGEASGLDIAAKYLNEKPDARNLVVQVSPLATEFVHYYFHGRVYRADRQTNLSPDYEVVYIRDAQIGRVPQTGTLNGELEAVITLNGIDHVWIYKVRSL